jgi:N-acetylglucosaminyldiphosphoundecaprenol N-acetyl-beta-D-mannosaminyltransferase
MTTLICNPSRECVNSLGIPVDKLTLESAVNEITSMARMRDRARLVSTLNVDFLVNSLGTALSRPRHPELLEVLRSSDLVTADGFPIVWLSRLLGRPLPGRVCGSDLTPALAERAASEGLSLFLLGGGEGVAAEAGALLEKRYPGLRIAGTAAPMIRTSGRGLAETEEDDATLLAQIHESGADILLVGLGNPKQELWFNRNRGALRTPVSIGVGGTFEFITGKTRRAPAIWQRLNLEWVYRMLQDPARLWRRYSKGLLKLSVLAAPVVASRAGEMLAPFGRGSNETPRLDWRRLWSSRDESLSLLRLPRVLDTPYLATLTRELLATENALGLRILDFSGVRRLRLSAQQELFNLSALTQRQRGQLQIMGMRPKLRRALAAARLLDLLEGSDRGLDPLRELAGNDDEGRQPFSCRSYIIGDSALLLLSGRITRESLRAVGFVECAMVNARGRRCVIDLRNVSMLESSGIGELIPLLEADGEDNHQVLFSGVSHGTRQMLRMAEVAKDVRPIDDQQLLNIIHGGQ